MKKQSNELHFNLGFFGGFVFMFAIVYIILLLLSKRILPYFEGATNTTDSSGNVQLTDSQKEKLKEIMRFFQILAIIIIIGLLLVIYFFGIRIMIGLVVLLIIASLLHMTPHVDDDKDKDN
tara:strand:+ start:114 stop:476 length:363 start_codon:yes stop_codon:yes gene_type:complete